MDKEHELRDLQIDVEALGKVHFTLLDGNPTLGKLYADFKSGIKEEVESVGT